MKKAILALALVAFAAANSFAATKAAPAKKAEFGVLAGIDLLLSPSGLTDAYGLGFGGGAFGRYCVNENASIGVNLAYNTFSGKDIEGTTMSFPTLSTFDILAQGKMKFGKGSAKPYILAGLGLCIVSIAEQTYTIDMGWLGTYTYTSPSVSESDLMLQPGFGVEFGSKTKFFVETKLSIVMTEGDTLMTLPVNVGVQF